MRVIAKIKTFTVLSRNVVDPKSKCKSNRNLKKITVNTHSLSISQVPHLVKEVTEKSEL
jgi:hypothetical protein